MDEREAGESVIGPVNRSRLGQPQCPVFAVDQDICIFG